MSGLSDKMFKIKPMSATQSTVSDDRVAAKAIDGDSATWSSTLCKWNTDIWFKLKFSEMHCFTDVKILDRYQNYKAFRKSYGKVFVINKAISQKSLCGVVRMFEIKEDTYGTHP